MKTFTEKNANDRPLSSSHLSRLRHLERNVWETGHRNRPSGFNKDIKSVC